MAQIVSQEDARQMFLNSVVEVNSVPVYIIEDMDGGLRGVNLATGKSEMYPRDAELLLAPTVHTLGFYNGRGGNATFLQRAPTRQYKVGWAQSNVENLPNLSLTENWKPFMDMLNRVFPRMKDAEKATRGSNRLVAFDRQFALDNVGEEPCAIYSKRVKVGRLHRGVIELHQAHKYLQTELEGLYNV